MKRFPHCIKKGNKNEETTNSNTLFSYVD
jgi:hypothetical protein